MTAARGYQADIVAFSTVTLQQRQDPARTRRTTPMPTDSGRHRVRPGQTGWHVPHCKAVWRRVGEAGQRHRLPKVPVQINDFSLPRDDQQSPLGGIQMIDKSNAGAMKGKKLKLRRAPTPFDPDDVTKPLSPTGGSPPRTSSQPDNQVTLDGDGNIHLAYKATNDKEARRPLQGAADHPEPRRAWPITTC